MRAALRSFPVSQRVLIFVIFFKKYPYLFRACVFSYRFFFYGIGDGGMGNVRTGGKRQRGRGRRTRKKKQIVDCCWCSCLSPSSDRSCLGFDAREIRYHTFLLLVSSSLLPLLPTYLPLYWLVSLLCSSLSALFSTFLVDTRYVISCYPQIRFHHFFLQSPIMSPYGVAAQSRSSQLVVTWAL